MNTGFITPRSFGYDLRDELRKTISEIFEVALSEDWSGTGEDEWEGNDSVTQIKVDNASLHVAGPWIGRTNRDGTLYFVSWTPTFEQRVCITAGRDIYVEFKREYKDTAAGCKILDDLYGTK